MLVATSNAREQLGYARTKGTKAVKRPLEYQCRRLNFLLARECPQLIGFPVRSPSLFADPSVGSDCKMRCANRRTRLTPTPRTNIANQNWMHGPDHKTIEPSAPKRKIRTLLQCRPSQY